MRKILLQLVLPLLGLCGLFLLLAFAPDDSQDPPALLEMSVILRESDSSAALRQGIEQAAADLNVELRFLTPSSDNSAREQAQLLSWEVSSGAAAILLFPADREALAQPVASAAEQAAVVTLETDMTAYGAKTCVSVDNSALGETLARAVLNGVPKGGTVLLLDSAPGDNGIRERLDSAAGFLTAEGRQVVICPSADAADIQAALEGASIGAVAAFEASALEAASDLASAIADFPLLYGAGSTSAIAAGLEQNYITAIAAQNDFSAGYLAVQAAASAARYDASETVAPLPFSFIRRENMYNDENQKLLFPVT
jgi:ABC-type sugar transport system substrate-binding protein